MYFSFSLWALLGTSESMKCYRRLVFKPETFLINLLWCGRCALNGMYSLLLSVKAENKGNFSKCRTTNVNSVWKIQCMVNIITLGRTVLPQMECCECRFRETNGRKRNISRGFVITYNMHLAQFLCSMIYLSYSNSQFLPCYLLGFYLGQGE